MICGQCKRRPAVGGKRFCVTCAALMKARYLEGELVRTKADLEVMRTTRTRVSKPVDRLEVADASITRCRLCDSRFIPDSGHRCRRAYKRKEQIAA